MKIVLLLAAMLALATASEAAPVTLTWTAPGDDGNVGTASQYDLRYALAPLVDTDTVSYWAGMVQVTGEPVPLVAGTTQSWTGDFVPGSYWFLLKTADEVPNWSGFSNGPVEKVVADSQPPFCVQDLR